MKKSLEELPGVTNVSLDPSNKKAFIFTCTVEDKENFDTDNVIKLIEEHEASNGRFEATLK